MLNLLVNSVDCTLADAPQWISALGLAPQRTKTLKPRPGPVLCLSFSTRTSTRLAGLNIWDLILGLTELLNRICDIASISSQASPIRLSHRILAVTILRAAKISSSLDPSRLRDQGSQEQRELHGFHVSPDLSSSVASGYWRSFYPNDRVRVLKIVATQRDRAQICSLPRTRNECRSLHRVSLLCSPLARVLQTPDLLQAMPPAWLSIRR